MTETNNQQPTQDALAEPVLFNKSILPYDLERGGQSIEVLDLNIFKNKHQNLLNNYIQAKVKDIQEEYNNLCDLFHWNEYVMQFKINFEPVVGKTYYLYDGSSKFMSILSPKEFSLSKYIASTKLTAEGYWIKI